MSQPLSEYNYAMQILENSPDGIFTISPELEICYVNPAFSELIGYSAKELIGTPITTYLGDLDILNVCMSEVAATGRCRDQETIFKRKNGSQVHISKNVQAIFNDNGTIREILVFIRDLTDLHRLNRELSESRQQLVKHTHELQTTLTELRATQRQLIEAEKMASLGGLVAGVAHEINTPIGISITASTTMHEAINSLKNSFADNTLKKSALESYLEHTAQACTILHNNLRRASDLVSSFKKVAVDQSVDEWRIINLHDYCDEILISLGPQYKQRPIKVINGCDPTIDICINPGLLYQIISNLVLNSLIHGYGENGGGTIRIDARDDGTRLLIDYHDDGCGIQPEHLSQIFIPFYTTKRGNGGSGLGLSIIYNLVTGPLKGSISVDSTPGNGVHFHISLPNSNTEHCNIA